eukprot:GHRQ01036796.1.p1 GENE.GHRQ01036796.1~~GHRQ01036796.1.p1  ORF type:complete len:151 (-),score=18.83 GHRQ01036796.1:11-463(-)
MAMHNHSTSRADAAAVQMSSVLPPPTFSPSPRSYSYLPFPPGTGEGGFRGDAARWPGGGAHDFLMRLTHELLPMLQQRYGLAQVGCRATWVHKYTAPAHLCSYPRLQRQCPWQPLVLNLRSHQVGLLLSLYACPCRTHPGWRLAGAPLLA